MKYIAICFTDKKYEKTRERYANELQSKNIFDKVIQYKPEDFDEDFILKHKNFIDSNPTGYGYWIWKPYFVSKALDTMDDGDILVYGDAGNDMPGDREDCLHIFNMALSVKKGVSVVACKQGWNIRWIKADLYKAMGWETFRFAFLPMAEAARIVIEKNKKTVKFAREWLAYSTNDYHNIDNTVSRIRKFFFLFF